MRRYILFIMFLCLHYVARGQTAKAIFWYDNDYETKTENALGASATLDVSALTDGYHTLHVQVDGGKKGLSAPRSQYFIKVSPVAGAETLTYRVTIDDILFQEKTIANSNGVIGLNLDVSALPEGLHILSAQVATPNGAATATRQAYFYRVALKSEIADTKCYYSIDNSDFVYQADVLEDGTYHFDLDVASLSLGLHSVIFMISNSHGLNFQTKQVFFVKLPVGGNGIIRYDYWLNDDDATYRVVELAGRQNPFDMITQLDVAEQPFCSKRYLFSVENDKPFVYAQNDIHLRFITDIGYLTDAVERYADERTREEVKELTAIKSQVPATIDRPEENTIKWFTFEAGWSDSLIFKADQQCMIEVYSPTGELMYSAEGEAATQYGGCQSDVEGTYYLAVHDVEDADASTVNIDFVNLGQRFILLDEDDTILPPDTTNVFAKVVRSIEAGKWQTIVLPFDMDGELFKAVFGDDAQLLNFVGHEAEEDNKGATSLIKVKFETISTENGIKANHPYLIKVAEPVKEWLLSHVDLLTVERPVVAAEKRTATGWSEFVGTYVAEANVPEHCLYLDNEVFCYSSGDTRLKAFRAYFDLNDVLADLSEGYNSRIEFVIDGVATKIQAISTENARKGDIYDLSGRKVNNRSLKKGIYIIGNQKVLVK